MNSETPLEAIAFVVLAFSVLQCFFGYALFRLFVALLGFLIIGAVAWYAADHALDIDSSTLQAIIALAGGIVGGWAAWNLYKLGVFVFGAIAGGLLAAAVYYANDATPDQWVIAIAAIVSGILAVVLQKAWIVLTTSALGAAGILVSVSLFIGNKLDFSGDDITLGEGDTNRIVILALWLALTAAGVAFQYFATGRRTRKAPVAPDGGAQPPVATEPDAATVNGRRGAFAAIALLIAAIGIGAAWWFIGGEPGPQPDAAQTGSPPATAFRAPRGPQHAGSPQRASSSQLPHRVFFPQAFRGAWDLAEGCANGYGTDMRLNIADKSVQFYESTCNMVSLTASGNHARGMARCQGEGSTWTETLEFRLDDGKLFAYANDGSSVTRVRCDAIPGTSAATVSAQSATSRPASNGRVNVEGTLVAWKAPIDPARPLATFSFTADGYRNSYELDCEARQFRWTRNVDLRTQQTTGNSVGADWHSLSERSTKANAAFQAACAGIAASSSTPAPAPGQHLTGEQLKLAISQQMARDGELSTDCAAQIRADPDLISVEHLDLNLDGLPEYAVYGGPGCACMGARRCSAWVYELRDDAYRQLLGMIQPDGSIEALPSKTLGYLDLQMIGVGGSEVYRDVFQFNGANYASAGVTGL